jgi:hypothetical protein
MGENQKGFKSLVNRMKIENQDKQLAMKITTRGQLRKGDRPWKGRLWENCQTMNKKLMRGRPGGKRWHNTPKSCHSAREVNETFGQRRFSLLPGEISPALRPVETGSVHRGNTADDRGEVSRGHSSRDKTNWGATLARLNCETHGTNHPAKG